MMVITAYESDCDNLILVHHGLAFEQARDHGLAFEQARDQRP